ncbi:MAG: hypothetical protein JSV49_01385 [Thermoplasmata archaeon]|nr:MAG: hypothetical protein JSV49_01385 [Thermoplasmata archaeon]
MDPLKLSQDLAKEMQDVLKENHICTLVYGPPVTGTYVEGKSKIPLFVIVNKFDSTTANIMADLVNKWTDYPIEGPYIAVLQDLEGMSDSVPDELLDVTLNYKLLAGEDVLKSLPQLDREHMRAQAELAVRRYIFTLRWTLTHVLKDYGQLEGYLNNLAFYCQLAIQVYHRLSHPKIVKKEQHLKTFYDEFPEGKECMEILMNYAYGDASMLDREPVDLITCALDTILLPLLRKIDEMGKVPWRV